MKDRNHEKRSSGSISISLSFFLLALFSLLMFNQDQDPKKSVNKNSQSGAPKIETDLSVIDFGDLIAGEDACKKIKIMNKGQGDLMILRVSFTCGCSISRITLPTGDKIVPKRNRETKIGRLRPGESAQLELKYLTLGHEGKHKKKLIIYSDDPANRAYTLPIKANVWPAFTFEPRRFEFNDVQKNTRVSRTMILRSTQDDDFTITGIPGLPQYLLYKVEKVKGSTKPSVKIILTLTEEAPVGSYFLKVKIKIDSPKVKETKTYASFNVLPSIVFKTGVGAKKDILDFELVPRKGESVKIIDIINTNPHVPYIITEMKSASTPDEMISAELTTIEKGVSYKIKVTVRPDEDTQYFKGDISVHSDHPDLKEKKIRVFGWITKE